MSIRAISRVYGGVGRQARPVWVSVGECEIIPLPAPKVLCDIFEV